MNRVLIEGLDNRNNYCTSESVFIIRQIHYNPTLGHDF